MKITLAKPTSGRSYLDVHAAGCKDLLNGRRYHLSESYTFNAASRLEVAADWYIDIIAENLAEDANSPYATAEAYLDEFKFLPCAAALPHTTPTTPTHTNPKDSDMNATKTPKTTKTTAAKAPKATKAATPKAAKTTKKDTNMNATATRKIVNPGDGRARWMKLVAAMGAQEVCDGLIVNEDDTVEAVWVAANKTDDGFQAAGWIVRSTDNAAIVAGDGALLNRWDAVRLLRDFDEADDISEG